MDWPPRYSTTYRPGAAQEHWSPDLETMDPEQRNRLVFQKLREQVRYASAQSGFYRDFYAGAPVDPANLAGLEEFSQLPVLTKEEIRREQEEFPPYGRFLCVPPEDVFRVHGTSGTTGRPTVFGISKDDWDRIGEAHARILWGAGLRPGDMVMVAAVFSLYVGSWGGSGRHGAVGRHILSLRRRRARPDGAGRRMGGYGPSLRPLRYAVLCPLLGRDRPANGT